MMVNDTEKTQGRARFSFASEDFEVEFSGTQEFVTQQIDLVRRQIRTILGGGQEPTDAPATPGVAAGGDVHSPLEKFYLKARTREGRGALQDTILIFAWYLVEIQKKQEFSIEDLNFCFDLLNIQRPKSLANTLGILKRDRGWLESGSKRGTYNLTLKGREKVKGLVDV